MVCRVRRLRATRRWYVRAAPVLKRSRHDWFVSKRRLLVAQTGARLEVSGVAAVDHRAVPHAFATGCTGLACIHVGALSVGQAGAAFDVERTGWAVTVPGADHPGAMADPGLAQRRVAGVGDVHRGAAGRVVDA